MLDFLVFFPASKMHLLITDKSFFQLNKKNITTFVQFNNIQLLFVFNHLKNKQNERLLISLSRRLQSNAGEHP